MKVLMPNGGSHEKGCIYTALSEVANTLAKELIQRLSGLEISPLAVALPARKLCQCNGCG